MRPRKFEWPTPQDVSEIVNFGFHIVPVGHPLSFFKSMEWRISFSVAERILVWSFNHVQMQCYAVLKIILKEFIKINCSPKNQVLCSYFIKTFLFWKYEATKLDFWCSDNLKECIKYLLAEFSKCIQEGVLRHYFIPKFNLLSIKLTREAQTELVQLLDTINQSDIAILKECRTFHSIWSEFLQVRETRHNFISSIRIRNMFMHDQCMMQYFTTVNCVTNILVLNCDLHHFVRGSLTLLCKTPLLSLVPRRSIFKMHIHRCCLENRSVYKLYRNAKTDTCICSFDISTYKLWTAIKLYMKGDFSATLDLVNRVLSSIPPCAMFYDGLTIRAGNEAKELYVDLFKEENITVVQRARKAWMFKADLSSYKPPPFLF